MHNCDRSKPWFLSHLFELRTRTIKVLTVLSLTSILCLTYSDYLFLHLCLPVFKNFEGINLIGTGPTDAFMMKLKLSVLAALMLTLPYSMFHFWAFVSPGLYAWERRLAIPFIVSSATFFIAGAAFCYLVVLPLAFRFFSGEYTSIAISPDIRVDEAVSFSAALVFTFGLIFELPLVASFLTLLKLTTAKSLLKKWRTITLSIFVVAAIATPPDVVSQVLLAAPMFALYALSVTVCYVTEMAMGTTKGIPEAN